MSIKTDPYLLVGGKLYRILCHAICRMAERRITRRMITETIQKGIHYQDRTRLSLCMEFHGMRVVADPATNPIQIISVMHVPSRDLDFF